MWFCAVEYLLGRLWLSKRIWFFLWFALSFGHLHQVCMSQNGSTDAKTAESDCVCDACLWQFRLTKSRLYKELLLFLSFPFRPASFVAVSAHSSCGVRYYFTAWGNYKIVLKFTLSWQVFVSGLLTLCAFVLPLNFTLCCITQLKCGIVCLGENWSNFFSQDEWRISGSSSCAGSEYKIFWAHCVLLCSLYSEKP